MSKEKPLIHNKRRNKLRIHSEGKETLIVCGWVLAAVIIFSLYVIGHNWISYTLIGLCTIVYLILLNFFRCPIRMFDGPTTKTVVAPADGRVVVIEEVDEEEYFHDRRLMISIFMSPVNVHANWIPCEGRVIKVDHQSGNFRAAYLPKASTENERSMVVIETPHGQQVMARQIAGAMARRIVTYAEEGQECYIDDHMGFIKFGSRVDLFLPLDFPISVALQDKVKNAISPIAEIV